MESKKSSTLYMCGVIGFVYVRSHQLFCNLTNMHRKPLACFYLCVGIVSEAYHPPPH
jgi:hypothetical protein